MMLRGVAACVLATGSAVLADQLLMDFNNIGFGWTYGGFTQTIGPAFVTLADATDGWGGGGVTYSSPRDFSPLANGSFRIDTRVNSGNAASQFTLALRDVNNNQGKWTMGVDHLPVGSFTTLTASTNLATPQTGTNDWLSLDLSRITQLELQGQWSGASSFNMSFDNLTVHTGDFVERYPGHDPNAPWRAQAQQRIDQLRKAELKVVVRDELGNPVPGATVQVRQQNHAFGFGSAMMLYRLASDSPTNRIYQEKAKQLFNLATSSNDLKWPAWNGEWSAYDRASAQAGLDWLRENDIRARGHVMVWPGYNNLPIPVKAMIDEYRAAGTSSARQLELQQLLRSSVLAHIQEIGSATAGKIETWDVVNEPRTNRDLMDILGNDVMAQWFTAARAAAPDARLYINEYDIITSTASSANSRNTYYNTIASLKDSGAPIGGLGMQGHFTPGTLTGPEQVWAVLDRFAQLGLDIQITEYDLDTTDRALQKDYLRDLMTAVFAHGSVTDFIQWNFWAGAHWRPEAALFDLDWNMRPHGEEYLRLVFDEWWTSDDLTSLATGEATLRGFLGDYAVTVSHAGFLNSYPMRLGEPGEEYALVVTVPEPTSIALASLAGLLLLRRSPRTPARSSACC